MEQTTTAVPFERLPEEPAAAFEALLVHRDTGPGRSFCHTAELTGTSESTLRRLSSRWRWPYRLAQYDDQVLQQRGEQGAKDAQERHRAQLMEFRDTQRARSERLAEAAAAIMELVVTSARSHLEQGTLMAPRELAAAISSAAKALDASCSTVATALGVDQLLDDLDREQDAIDGRG